MSAPTCFPSAQFSMNGYGTAALYRQHICGNLRCHFEPRAHGASAAESQSAGRTGTHHQQSSGERSRPSLPGCVGIRADLKRLKREIDSGKSSAAASRQRVWQRQQSRLQQPGRLRHRVRKGASGGASIFADLSRGRRNAEWQQEMAVGSVAVVIVAAIAGAFFFSHRSRTLTAKDSILLSDFVNTTGDPVFDVERCGRRWPCNWSSRPI